MVPQQGVGAMKSDMGAMKDGAAKGMTQHEEHAKEVAVSSGRRRLVAGACRMLAA